MGRTEWGFKASETLLGIETSKTEINSGNYRCFKASETLLGIETLVVSCHLSSTWLQSL